MPQLEVEKVHHFRRVRGSQERELTKVTPYIRVSEEGEPPVFLQAGNVYKGEGGNPLKDYEWPDWLRGKMKRMNPEALAEAGFEVPEDEEAVEEVKAAPKKKTVTKLKSSSTKKKVKLKK